MTPEEKARAYDEALDRARKLYNGEETSGDVEIACEIIFPELLKEFEDEKIRKALLNYLKKMWGNCKDNVCGIHVEDAITWLEKQGEQKTYSWKPTKEQFEALDYAYNSCPDTERGNYYEGVLETLIKDLHKLEKQSETFTKKDVDDAYLKGVSDTKTELEKQGGSNPYSGVTFEYNDHTWGMCARDGGVEILVDGEIKERVFLDNLRGEQNTTEFDDTNAKRMFIKALESVEELKDKGYKLTDCDKNSWWEDFKICTNLKTYISDVYLSDAGQCVPPLCKDNVHRWTIEDAKDGDVLVLETDEVEWVLIYKEIVTASSEIPHDLLRYYSMLSGNYYYGKGVSALVTEDYEEYLKPATKEQCDLLFQKMKEAGYEWDAEKKELKKIEDEPENYKKQLMSGIEDGTYLLKR